MLSKYLYHECKILPSRLPHLINIIPTYYLSYNTAFLTCSGQTHKHFFCYPQYGVLLGYLVFILNISYLLPLSVIVVTYTVHMQTETYFPILLIKYFAVSFFFIMVAVHIQPTHNQKFDEIFLLHRIFYLCLN